MVTVAPLLLLWPRPGAQGEELLGAAGRVPEGPVSGAVGGPGSPSQLLFSVTETSSRTTSCWTSTVSPGAAAKSGGPEALGSGGSLMD